MCATVSLCLAIPPATEIKDTMLKRRMGTYLALEPPVEDRRSR
jgi:hypothetical protein